MSVFCVPNSLDNGNARCSATANSAFNIFSPGENGGLQIDEMKPWKWKQLFGQCGCPEYRTMCLNAACHPHGRESYLTDGPTVGNFLHKGPDCVVVYYTNDPIM